MKVVLRSDVDGVGRRGDIVDVAGGFARNFLLPQGRAMLATDGVAAQAAAMRRGRDLREAADRERRRPRRQILAGAVLRVEARAGSAGRLFGSVGSGRRGRGGEGAEGRGAGPAARGAGGADQGARQLRGPRAPLRRTSTTVVTVEVVAAAG